MRELRMPIVTALHTILARPSLPQRRVIEEIAEISRRLVVMSCLGATTVSDVYDIALDRIDVIPPGIPNVVFPCDTTLLSDGDTRGSTTAPPIRGSASPPPTSPVIGWLDENSAPDHPDTDAAPAL